MDKPNPFFDEYERKPAWLQQKLHVPSGCDMAGQLDTMVAKVRSGHSMALAVIPASKGIGVTHFINREFKPALEARGCVCAMAKKNGRPWDERIKHLLDLPEVVTSLAAPNACFDGLEQHPEWLPESVSAGRKRMDWRKRCGIASEAKGPYPPKVFSHTLRKRIERTESPDDEDEEFFFGHPGMRRNSDRKFSNITALGELASQNNRVLCIIKRFDRPSAFGCSSKTEARIAVEYLGKELAPYLEAKNLWVIVVMDRNFPLLTRRLAISGYPIARLSKKGAGWVKRILKAHQDESGAEWFTDDALDTIAKLTKGRVSKAMGVCSMMAIEAKDEKAKLPLDQDCVMRQWRNGKHEGYCEDVRIRF